MNEVLNCIKMRRSTRKFKKEQIPDTELEAILESGRFAPSGGNSQSSHLIVIQNNQVLQELTGLVEQEFAKMELQEEMYKSIQASIRASQKGGYQFSYNAPTLVVVANRKGYGNAMADSACLLENMMLAAEALKLGSCWINQLHWLDENANIRAFLQRLGLGEDETVCGTLALGKKDAGDQEPLRRIGNPVTYVR